MPVPTSASDAREVLLVCTIDTEEDNWNPVRDGITVTNIDFLLEHHRWLTELGVDPTYFVTHQVLVRPAAVDVLRAIAATSHGELGAHLHPWNTPPLEEPMDARHSMLCNLGPALQVAKLERLGESFAAALGASPLSFRAGRCALGPATVEALVRHGYRSDSSVLPFHDLGADHGPNFVGAPVDVYRIQGGDDPRRASRTGALVELPLSSGFSRTPFRRWRRLHAMLDGTVGRALRLPGIASRTGILKRVTLAPERESVRDMVQVALRLVEEGARCLVVTWHSPTLFAGCTPYSRTNADVERLRFRIGELVATLGRVLRIRTATLGAASRALAPALLQPSTVLTPPTIAFGGEARA